MNRVSGKDTGSHIPSVFVYNSSEKTMLDSKKLPLVCGALVVVLVLGLCVQKPKTKRVPSLAQPEDYLKIDHFRGKFSVSQSPIVGRVVDLIFTVSPIKDAPNTTVKLILPYGIEALNENLTWKVNLEKDEKIQFKVPIRVIREGEWRIRAYVESPLSKEYKIANSYYAYIISNKNEAYLSETSKEGNLEQPPEKASYVPGEVIVGFRKVPCTSTDALQLIEKYGGKIKDTMPQINAVLVKVPIGKEREFIDKISKEDVVEYAHLNYHIRALG